jgi:hypothetical protein
VARAAAVVGHHLPTMAGGAPGPLAEASISTGVGAGNPGLPVWVLALIAASLSAGVTPAQRRAPAAEPAGGAPDAALPAYLCLTGLSSIAVYTFVACSAISLDTLRYDLLALLLPVGALLHGLGSASAPVRAGLTTATLLWTLLSADDYRALAAETRTGRWPDPRGEATARLVAAPIDVLWGDARLAYVVSFRSQERVVVAPVTVHRIDDYARRARAANARFLGLASCSGDQLAPGIWLCPPPSRP